MADVTVKYKNNIIAELNSNTTTKTLETSGKYCEDNIQINYTPSSTTPTASNSKTYEITLSKSSGWVLLTTLDAEVLEHINDANLLVSLANFSTYEYAYYTGNIYIAGNKPFGYNSTYASYGMANRMNSETSVSQQPIYYPANNTETSYGLGGFGSFRVSDGKYYVRAYDGFIAAGTYRLTFTW